jgi:hypothetical protein
MRNFMDFIIKASPGYIRCAPEYEGRLNVAYALLHQKSWPS